MKNIYLDYAAATPLDPRVEKVMKPYFAQKFYNPSAMYLSAQAVRRDLEAARHTVAKLLGAKPAEVIFTSGATEANNLALKGVMAPDAKSQLIISAIEHESVLAPALELGAKFVPVNSQGLINLGKLERLINDRTRLISIIMVSNEIGTLQPLSQVAMLIKKIRAGRARRRIDQPLYLHTDGAQAANLFELNVARLGVDLMTINGSKLYGPKQTGVLYVRAGTALMPQIVGGGQEFGLRSGTENVPGALGLAKAFEIADKLRRSELKRLTELRQEFIAGLQKHIPASKINGHAKKTAPHIVSVLIPGQDAERLMMELDERGIQVAVGSACSAADEEPSHVLRAIGLSEAEARSCLRFSFGRQTSQKDIRTAVLKLAEIIRN